MTNPLNDSMLLLTSPRGLRFAVVSEPRVLGRSPTSDFVVDCNSVSRSHAKLHLHSPLTPGELIVQDLGSLNGTFINKKRVTEGSAKINDWLRFGNVEFCVRDGDYLDEESTISAASNLDASGMDGLSPAQRRVLSALLEGNSEKDVATRLKLSPHTVHNHVREIYARFGVHSRPELMARCLLARPHNEPPVD
jgi:DNA-binding CsgD family transcriptional regulator